MLQKLQLSTSYILITSISDRAISYIRENVGSVGVIYLELRAWKPGLLVMSTIILYTGQNVLLVCVFQKENN